MGFGELALQSDQPRSATMQTSEKTELLVTKRSDYEMYAGQVHRQFIEQRVKFLRQCPRIEDALQTGVASTQDIAAMANCLNEVPLGGNAVACRQGDPVDHMVFVRSGQLAMLRCVDLEQAREAFQPKPPETRASGRNAGRPTMGGSDPVPPPPEKRDSGVAVMQMQTQEQLTENLAKAMMEMKRKDRRQKMANIEQKEKEAEALESRRSSIVGDVFGGAPIQSADSIAKNLARLSQEAAATVPQPADEDSQATPEGMLSVPSAGGGSMAGGGEHVGKGRGKAIWKRLQTSVKAASAVDRFVSSGSGDADEVSAGGGNNAGRQNVEHFSEVSAARRRYTQYTYEHTKPPLGLRRSRVQGNQLQPAKVVETRPPKKRVRILRIGTVGPCQYFGDKHVCNNEAYPVSLVSDPVAEIYVMSKHDILRRVPKKLFSALFSSEKEAVPSDTQLLDMHRQTERWNAFRRSMHGEALGNLSARSRGWGPCHSSRSGSRTDALSNLEFLGVSPQSDLGESLLQLPQNKGVALTPKDEETFSQVSARFLRRFDMMKRDPGLRGALATAGLMRNSRLHDGLPGSALDDDDQDPMAFRFEQHWYRLQKDPIGLDLDDVLSEDTSKVAGNAVSSFSGAAGAPTPPRSQRRGNHITDAHKRRVSAMSSLGTGALGTAETSPGVSPALSRAGSGNGDCGASTPASPRRKSVRVAGAAAVELPALDGTSEPQALGAAGSGRRVVAFTEV